MEDSKTDWFAGVEQVVAEPIKFKLQLAIGEDAYASLRAKKVVFDVWDTFGAASTAATLAKSSIVAATFFSSNSLLASLGIGVATTPVGWVIGAAVVGGGAWVGITRYLRKQTEARTRTIPEFINTPLDIIGLALFDLMAPLVLKVAKVDGTIDPSEEERIVHWFVRQWGYDPVFVERGMAFFATHLEEVTIAEMTTALAHYKRESPDCNYRAMSEELIRFLREVIEADGVIDEREEMAIERISRIFEAEGGVQLGRTAKDLGRKISSSASTAGASVAKHASQVRDTTVSAATRIGQSAANAMGEAIRHGSAGATALKAKVVSRKKSAESKK